MTDPGRSNSTDESRGGFSRLPVRLRLALKVVVVQLGFLLVLRLAFLLAFRQTGGELGVGEVLGALWLGTKFDLRLVLILSLPLILLGPIPWLDPVRRAGARRFWLFFFVAAQTALLLIYSVDFGHYGYVHERLNASLIDQLGSPGIAAQMVWETYPVIPGVLGVVVFLLLSRWVFKRLAFAELDRSAPAFARWPRRVAWAAFALFVAMGIYGKLSWYPLRWSDAYAHTNPFTTALSLNPVLFFVDSFPNREAPFDEELLREHYDELARWMRIDEPDREGLSFGRKVVPEGGLPGTPNIVVIHLESWAGFQTGVLGQEMNPSAELDPSPFFDSICEEGILFSKFFVPRGPTARSVWALVTGIPDMNPLRSASRNPRIVSQHTLINALEGYEKYYFLGGSATWANIRGILAHNIEGLKIYEEGDYVSPRGDVWGISDLAMMEEAVDVLGRAEKPIFAFVQTSGNHRPYTIPEDPVGFVVEEVDDETLLANGFASLEAYNGFRFMDHSLKHFFETVEKSPLAGRTVFFMYGDHGVPAPHGIPWEMMHLPALHVPLLIYAPGLITEPRRIDSVASLVDLMPTALGLLGLPYYNQGMGRDLLVPRPAEEHFAYISQGFLTDEECLKVSPDGRPFLYPYASKKPREEITDRDPERTAELLRMYQAFDAWVYYGLYHNLPRAHPDGGEERGISGE